MAAKRRESSGGIAVDPYTGMLIVSLLATLTGLLFVFLDYNEYPGKQPPKVSAPPPPVVQPAQ